MENLTKKNNRIITIKIDIERIYSKLYSKILKI